MTPELPHELLEFLGQDEGEGALAVQLARTWDTWILEVDLVRVYSGVEVRVTGDAVVVRGEVWLDGQELPPGFHELGLGDRVLWWEDEALVQARVVRARGLPIRPRMDRGQGAVLGLAAVLFCGLLGSMLLESEGRWDELRTAPRMERVVRVVLPPGLGEDHPDIEDHNLAAGPGQSQSGPKGQAGAPVGGDESGTNLRTRGQSTDRSPQRVERSAISVLSARGLSYRPGRSVTGLTSTSGLHRLGLGADYGPGYGFRGQLTSGRGNGAEGLLTELAGLYELGHGLGAAGRGFAPGEGDTGAGDQHGVMGGVPEAAPFF